MPRHFRPITRKDPLFSWHKPGKGIFLFGDNKDFQSNELDALLKTVKKGHFSVLVLPGSSAGVATRELAGAVSFSRIDIMDHLDDTDCDFTHMVARIVQDGPQVLLLSFPENGDLLGGRASALIRRFIQLTILEINFIEDAFGVYYLSDIERYLVEEQSGILQQINYLTLKRYSVGYHCRRVPDNFSDYSGVLSILGEQGTVYCCDDSYRSNKELGAEIKSLCNRFRPWYKRVIKTPRGITSCEAKGVFLVN